MAQDNLDSIADDLITAATLFPKHILHLDEEDLARGMSKSHLEVLFVLDDLGELPMSKIGETLYISKSYVTSLVDRLAAEGLVERQASEDDRRVTHVTLTEEGEAHLNEHKGLLRKSIKARMAGLSSQGRADLASALEKLLRILPQIGPRA